MLNDIKLQNIQKVFILSHVQNKIKSKNQHTSYIQLGWKKRHRDVFLYIHQIMVLITPYTYSHIQLHIWIRLLQCKQTETWFICSSSPKDFWTAPLIRKLELTCCAWLTKMQAWAKSRLLQSFMVTTSN